MIIFGNSTCATYEIMGKCYYPHKNVIFVLIDPLMMSISTKRHFMDIFGSGRPNSHWFRIFFGHNTRDTYKMIGQYHYTHIMETCCTNGPSNDVH